MKTEKRRARLISWSEAMPMSLGFVPVVACLVVASLTFAQEAAQGTQRLEAGERFREERSGIQFPARMMNFERVEVLKYPEPGGVSVTYELKKAGAVVARVTGFIYPHDVASVASLDEEFKVTVGDILSQRRGWRVLAEKEETVPGPGGASRRLGALFSTGGDARWGSPTVSALYLQRAEAYWLKWRCSMPSATMDDVVPQVRELMGALTARGR